ncbi:MAG TPA: isochorismatase family cysteine hydrolase [Solirubrobacteraceae bacterium]|jgi:nicotinamidase-related amidase
MSPSQPASQPDDQKTALVVIDVLNRYEHEDAEALVASVTETIDALSDLIDRGRRIGVPIVYVNDNYGDWNAARAELCARALAGRAPALVDPVLPPAGVAFLTKARHSAFYETQLDYLLRSEGIQRVVLAGQVTEQCVLYTALDAYVRHYDVVIPRDAVAHIHRDLAEAALEMTQRNMRAEIVDAEKLFAPEMTDALNGQRAAG